MGIKFIASLRIKNEERFIGRCLDSLFPLCDQAVLFDDHSTDATLDIARQFGSKVIILESPFEGLSETKDKNYLLKKTLALQPSWVINIDGDEELSPKAATEIQRVVASLDRFDPEFTSIAVRVVYFWNDFETVRVDGVYGKFFVPRIFTTWGQPDLHLVSFRYDANTAGFHCGSIPSQKFVRKDFVLDAPIWHYGYMDQLLRQQKFDFYTKADPDNKQEGGYLHISQGDPGGVPADQILKHAGPLQLLKKSDVGWAR